MGGVFMKMRFARHAQNLKKMQHFYVTLLGLSVVGSFKNHNGYDGIILGCDGGSWQIELTTSDDKPFHSYDEDDLLVLYFDSLKQYEDTIERLNNERVIEFAPLNPFWEENGKLYKDPEGFRIVLVKPS